MIYDREGKPISGEEYSRLLSPEYRRVDLTEIGPYVVSTVWLGVDHNFGGGPPLIFETMVFTSSSWNGEEPLLDLDFQRYSTEAEAKKGHEEMVLLIEATTQEAEQQALPQQKEN